MNFSYQGNNLNKPSILSKNSKTKSLNAKLELKFSMDHTDCDIDDHQKQNSTCPDLSESHLDDFASKSELFMSMNSYVDTSKTNDTISFLHQSQLDQSEFGDNKKLSLDSLRKQDIRLRGINQSKDEFMDLIDT